MKKMIKPKYSTLYFEEAVETNGWWRSHRFLILRRFIQISMLLLFAIPLGGVNNNILDNNIGTTPALSVSALERLQHEDGVRNNETWILKGSIANSELLSTIPLGDPFVFVQSLVAGNLYTVTGLIGVGLVTLFYFLMGGRLYCSFVCPINIVTDLSAWIRRQLRVNNQLSLSKKARFYILGATIVISALFHVIAWELVNPIAGIFRVLVFGGFAITNTAVAFVIIIFVLDIIGASNLWCGHLCPVGAFYSVLGRKSILHISAPKIAECDDCMDCYKACPEAHVLKPLIQNKTLFIEQSIIPAVGFSDCTRCGRCIDVCPERVFSYGISSKDRRIKSNQPITPTNLKLKES